MLSTYNAIHWRFCSLRCGVALYFYLERASERQAMYLLCVVCIECTTVHVAYILHVWCVCVCVTYRERRNFTTSIPNKLYSCDDALCTTE